MGSENLGLQDIPFSTLLSISCPSVETQVKVYSLIRILSLWVERCSPFQEGWEVSWGSDIILGIPSITPGLLLCIRVKLLYLSENTLVFSQFILRCCLYKIPVGNGYWDISEAINHGICQGIRRFPILLAFLLHSFTHSKWMRAWHASFPVLYNKLAKKRKTDEVKVSHGAPSIVREEVK